MTAEELERLLQELRACAEAQNWARGKTLAQAWDECYRFDWLVWLAARMEGRQGWPTRKQIVLAACDCAALALPWVPAGEARPRLAIETARKWVCGEVRLKEVRRAAEAAYSAAYAAYSAAYAAAYAAYAADAAAAADAADAYAAYAAYAASAAAYAAYAATGRVRAQCLEIFRRALRPQLQEPISGTAAMRG